MVLLHCNDEFIENEIRLESYLLRSFILLITDTFHLGRLIIWPDHLGLLSLVQLRDWDGLLQTDDRPLHLPRLHLPLYVHLVGHHGPQQRSVGPVHHRHRLAGGNKEVGWLAVALEHLQGGDGVGPGHGVDQAVVAHLQLDLLESSRHGSAGPRPLAVDINNGEAALKFRDNIREDSGA